MRPGTVIHGLIHTFGHGLWGQPCPTCEQG
jgi:hypothetical protein